MIVPPRIDSTAESSGLADLRNGAMRHPLQFVPDHQLDEPVVIEVGGRAGRDPLPVAQDADVVGDLEHFVEVVRDVEDGDAAFLEALDGAEEPLDIGAGQRRRRLVEDEQVSLVLPVEERAGQGDRRLLRGRQHRDGDVDVDVAEAEGLEALGRASSVGLPVDPAESARGVAGPHRDVLDGVQRVDESEVLVHEADAGGLGFGAVDPGAGCDRRGSRSIRGRAGGTRRGS